MEYILDNQGKVIIEEHHLNEEELKGRTDEELELLGVIRHLDQLAPEKDFAFGTIRHFDFGKNFIIFCEHQSFWLDFYILWRTVIDAVTLRGR